MPYWENPRASGGIGQGHYPGVKWDKYHIDILSREFSLGIRTGSTLWSGSNLFGDILSDLGTGLHRPPSAHRAVRQHQSGRRFSLGVRDRAWLRARPLAGTGHRANRSA